MYVCAIFSSRVHIYDQCCCRIFASPLLIVVAIILTVIAIIQIFKDYWDVPPQYPHWHVGLGIFHPHRSSLLRSAALSNTSFISIHTQCTSVELSVYITPPTYHPMPWWEGLAPFPSRQTMSDLGSSPGLRSCSTELMLLFPPYFQGCLPLSPPNLQSRC